MMKVGTIIDPIALADRLRKAAGGATEENRHDDAFLMELAADTIAAQGRAARIKVQLSTNQN